MHKVEATDSGLRIAWETPYESEDGGATNSARLGAGSGSTPSLIGDEDGATHVVITDGRRLMHVVVFDAASGEAVADHPVTFGNARAKNTVSEQSILVYKDRFVVVNNTPNGGLLGSKELKKGLESEESFFKMLTTALPVLVGDAPYGIEQFQYKDGKIVSVWSNPHISIPNGIPTMSASTKLMYGVGKRATVGAGGLKAGPFRGTWTIEALDWETGASVFHYSLGVTGMYNSFYAGLQVGPNCELITGVLGGIVRVRT
eukprot:GHVU01056318.1.p1 GENE.GHVU01056318.1~~GHVU01056318.1.p1  ORF type:complete len:259 (-),score=35.00 GHVU01056318.1:313-1089(-)